MTYIEYITESTVEAKLSKEFKNTVRFKLSESPDKVYLMIFVVPYKDRGNGIGTKFMKSLIKYAKELNKNIYLTPDDSYAEKEDMNKIQLTKWYKSLGFEKKRKDDFSTQAVMALYNHENY